MARRCWNCKKFEDHFYWEHLEETRYRFLKVMEGDFCHEMEFPKKFAMNFRVELPDLITLEDSNGELWRVGFLKEENDFYLTDGWEEFIDDHGIKEGYFLLFKYAGNSSFTVEIFDQNGSFRDTSNTMCTRNSVDEAGSNSKISQCSIVEVSSSSSLACDESKLAHGISDNKSSNGNCSGEVMLCKGKLREGLEDQCVKPSKIAWKGYYEKKLIQLYGNSRSETKGRTEVPEEIIKILQHFYPSQLASSSFIKIIKKSQFLEQPFMSIPQYFVSEHFPEVPETILCNQSGKQWAVSCKHNSGCFGFRGTSLKLFVRDNNLEEGDACIFELTGDDSDVIMDVVIVRAAEIYSMRKSLL